MKEEMTTKDLLDKFDHFTRVTDTGNVIIHPNLPYNHIELNANFVARLKRELETKIMMASAEIEKLDAATMFTIMMLEDSF